jgi:putative FmdB family regulatory protein
MPIYEYKCDDCGQQFDALRSMKDADNVIPCGECRSHQTKRKLSVFFAHNNSGKPITSNSSNCSGCSGGSCASCN